MLQISCMEGTALYPVSCRTFSFRNFHEAMNVDDIDTYSPGESPTDKSHMRPLGNDFRERLPATLPPCST